MKRFQTGIRLLFSLLLLNYGSQTGRFAKRFGDDEGPISEDTGASASVLIRITSHISLFREYAVARFGLDNLEWEHGRYRMPYRVTGVRYWFPTSSERYPYLSFGVGRYQSQFRGSFEERNLDIDSNWATGVTYGGGLLIPIGRLNLDLGVRYHSVEVHYSLLRYNPDQRATWIGFVGSLSLTLVKK